MTDGSKPRLLSVDDEPHILQGIKRSLTFRGSVEVTTTTDPSQALELVKDSEPFAVVISDLRMPGMDGVTLLTRVHDISPDTVRILLTGEHDFEAAVQALNSGHIFQFLSKPCPTPVLLKTVEDAVAFHRLRTAERVLLEQTLHGCVRALTEVLSLASPEAFARANRIRQCVAKLTQQMGIPPSWELDIAAMMSQVGCVTLPPDTASRLYHGESLSPGEESMVERLPSVAAKLLGNIPRLETVRQMVKLQNRRFDEGDRAAGAVNNEIPLGSRCLKVAADFDQLLTATEDPQLAIQTMRQRTGWYDSTVIDALAATQVDQESDETLQEVRLTGLRPGMVLAEDVKTKTGLLVLGRGQEITPGVEERISNLALRMSVVEPIRVRVRLPARRVNPLVNG